MKYALMEWLKKKLKNDWILFAYVPFHNYFNPFSLLS